jgi:hypothetical protein
VCEKRARVHGGSKSNGANSEEAAEKGRNEINQIATLLENAIWLPTLDTFRTFIAQNGSWWNQ